MNQRIPVSFTNTKRAFETLDAERLARLHFHLRTGDYFPTLVTILGFLEETLETYLPTDSSGMPKLECELIRGLCQDLMYLQEHYEIQPRLNLGN